MPFLIGTDEAGYGPNLGPLLITATVWRVQDEAPGGAPLDGDLYRRLKAVVCRTPSRAGARKRLAIADSKLLYNPAAGLELLERGVLAILSLLDCHPTDWREIWQMLDGDADSYLDQLPWHVGYDAPLPWAADREDLVWTGRRLRRGLAGAGVRLVTVRSTAVFPARFNACTATCGNKAEALSQLTLELVASVLPHCAGERVLIVCDKHGGRNRYGRLLQRQFPDPLVEVHRESLAESVYRWGATRRGSKSSSAPAASRFCRPRWLRWFPSICANWRCGPSTTSGAAACQTSSRPPAIRLTPSASSGRLPPPRASWGSTTPFCGAADSRKSQRTQSMATRKHSRAQKGSRGLRETIPIHSTLSPVVLFDRLCVFFVEIALLWAAPFAFRAFLCFSWPFLLRLLFVLFVAIAASWPLLPN